MTDWCQRRSITTTHAGMPTTVLSNISQLDRMKYHIVVVFILTFTQRYLLVRKQVLKIIQPHSHYGSAPLSVYAPSLLVILLNRSFLERYYESHMKLRTLKIPREPGFSIYLY